MIFKELEILVKRATQDAQSNLPTKKSEWSILITQSIKNIFSDRNIAILSEKLKVTTEDGNEVFKTISDEHFLRVPGNIETDDSEIDIDSDLEMAVVYDLAYQFTKDDSVLKQKHLLDKQDSIDNFVWNKFKEQYNG